MPDLSSLQTATVAAISIWAVVAAARRAILAWRPTWPRAWTRVGHVALPLAPVVLGVAASVALHGPTSWAVIVGGAWGAGASHGRTILRRLIGGARS